jgi:UDP-N-acetyl-D-galactosamine dehydrogenase
MEMFKRENLKIAVVGLGYVGLPLALEFAKKIETIGFDINETRVGQLKNKVDVTNESTTEEFNLASGIKFSCDLGDLNAPNFYIVTVPTPVDKNMIPDLGPVKLASEMIGSVLSKGDIVVFESTVYPGATEEIAVPALEKVSGLEFNKDFFVGYSPERINPGDKVNRLPNIIKITSGSNPETADFVDVIYNEIITAGTHKAPSIKVAEAAKVIENTQRDVNIALVNELAIIFDKLDIDTRSVIEAAGTKWNFQKLFPGLVGGHCIGVDPYYLAHKAVKVGYYPEIINSSRRINEGMASYSSHKLVRAMNAKKIHVVDSNILVLGFTFKENCPDIRNTQVINLVNEIKEHNANVDVFDPWADATEVKHEYGLELLGNIPSDKKYDAIVCAVAHDEFKYFSASDIQGILCDEHVVFDMKSVLTDSVVDVRF